ncbi:hypothetical protein VCHENC02_2597B, partial [Vibrio harveyi]
DWICRHDFHHVTKIFQTAF